MSSHVGNSTPSGDDSETFGERTGYGGGSRAEKAGVKEQIVHALSGVGSLCVVRES